MPSETAGDRLRREIEEQAEQAGLQLDQREEALLEEACRTATTLDALNAWTEENGPVDSEGKVQPAVVEARLARQTLQRLLGGIDLGTGRAQSPASQHGRRAAEKKWAHRR